VLQYSATLALPPNCLPANCRRPSCRVQKRPRHVLLGQSNCKLLLPFSHSSPSPLKFRAVRCRLSSYFRRNWCRAPSRRRTHSTATYRPLAKLSAHQASPLPCASLERIRLGPFRRSRPRSPFFLAAVRSAAAFCSTVASPLWRASISLSCRFGPLAKRWCS
jgi:hypothetical protein